MLAIGGYDSIIDLRSESESEGVLFRGTSKAISPVTVSEGDQS